MAIRLSPDKVPPITWWGCVLCRVDKHYEHKLSKAKMLRESGVWGFREATKGRHLYSTLRKLTFLSWIKIPTSNFKQCVCFVVCLLIF